MRRWCILLLLISFLAANAQEKLKAPVDYVDPNIGGVGRLLQPTLPYVQLPYGMARLAPVTTPGFVDRYLAEKIYGFPAAGASFLPVTGSPKAVPGQYASTYDHDFEIATPYYASEILETYGIKVEYTAARRTAYYRITFPKNAPARIFFNAGSSGEIASPEATVVTGSAENDGVKSYFYSVFSVPLSSGKTWSSPDRDHGMGFDLPGERSVEVKVGFSYISVDQASRNLSEDIPSWEFEKVKATARDIWNAELSKIAVTGGTNKQKKIFYTALYRSMGRMTDITEAGQQYFGLDKKVHQADGHPFYTDDGLWDTYRSLHPLQLLLDPSRQVDMVRSYLRMYDQTGWLPSFPTVGAERAFMIGHHAAPFILDVYEKGYREFDVNKAYEAIRKNAMDATLLPWRRGPVTELDNVYLKQGFFPALSPGEKETNSAVHPSERRQSISVTLEAAYDDWAVAQFANLLNKRADYDYFGQRAFNYRKLYNPAIGFMAPRSADGKWIASFDPKLGGGQGGRDYSTECNVWTYTYSVQHDIAGLIDLMGGRKNFIERLDQLFQEPYGTDKWVYLKQFPDCTANFGQYAQGNEPSFHIPYLYTYAGQPWKTQRRVRELMELSFDDSPYGIPGDDDGGAMSSWYVFNAMGFYPVTPGTTEYVIGSPIFTETRLGLPNGKTFTITANGASARHKYIQSAVLNGKPLTKAWLTHADIVNGGSLVLEMGSRPNKEWGADPAAEPISFSRVKAEATGAAGQ